MLRVLVALGCILLSPALVAAQSHTASENELLEQALAEYDAGHWMEAATLFKEVEKTAPTARTARALGTVSFELRDYVSATRYLERALSETRKPLTSKQRTETQALLDRAQRFVGHVRVQLSPADATLHLDGSSVEADAQHTLTLNPGDYELVVQAPGYAEDRRRLHIEAQQNMQLEVSLQRTVAGEVSSREVAAPAHSQAPGPAPAAAVADTSRPTRTALWVSAIAAVGFGAGSAISYGLAQSAFSRTDDACRAAPCSQARVKSLQGDGPTFETLGHVSLGLSIAALGTAVVFYVLDRNASEPTSSNVAVSVGPGGANVRASF